MPGIDLPHGVRNPVVTHTHPYPTRYHGGIWTRPVFGLPWVRTPFAVYRPSQLNGLGAPYIAPVFVPYKGLGNAGGWDVASGVFRRPAYDGGGVFNQVSGLGGVPPALAAAAVAGVAAFIGITYLVTKK